MPVRVRRQKRRGIVRPEAWAMKFASGHDYLDCLAALGMPNDPEVWDKATREAWAAHGEDFLSRRSPDAPEPWALRTHGDPRTCQ
jgi:hypothetical protein